MHIVIDGNIGSGKTTQLDLLETNGWSVKREPLDEWPLELFYKDMSRWALLLQMKILQTLRPVRDGVTVYERCLLSTRHVFWEYLRTNKLVTSEEDSVYQNAYERYVWYPDVYIFLNKSPKTAFEHIQKRKQVGDSRVSLKYLGELQTLYEKMITNVPCKVHIVQTEGRTPAEVYAEVSTILSLYTVKNENGVYSDNNDRTKMSKRTSVPHTQNANMCCVS
jgi:deoxyadenosine/deoxycytidine kinase